MARRRRRNSRVDAELRRALRTVASPGVLRGLGLDTEQLEAIKTAVDHELLVEHWDAAEEAYHQAGGHWDSPEFEQHAMAWLRLSLGPGPGSVEVYAQDEGEMLGYAGDAAVRVGLAVAMFG